MARAYHGEGNPAILQGRWSKDSSKWVLLIVDALAMGALWILASGARFTYSRFDYLGYARAAYVVALLPYIAVTSLAVINNLVLGTA